MPAFDPADLIGRAILLPPEENGERHRAKGYQKCKFVCEIRKL